MNELPLYIFYTPIKFPFFFKNAWLVGPFRPIVIINSYRFYLQTMTILMTILMTLYSVNKITIRHFDLIGLVL